MNQEIECIKCNHVFWAEVYREGHCPKCGKTFIWDSAGEGAMNILFRTRIRDFCRNL